MDPKFKYWLLSAAIAVIAVFSVMGLLSPAPPEYDYSKYVVNIHCAFPDVPETMPTLRTIYVPVSMEAADAIARDVFGITEVKKLSEDEDERLILGKSGVSLCFEGLYDIYFDCHAKKALINWSDEEAVNVVEPIISACAHQKL